jgi:hypothetical protein
MECDKFRERMADHIEGFVTPQEDALMRTHITSCRNCEEAYSDLEKTLRHIKSLEDVEPPAWLAQKVMAKVREEAPKQGLWKRFFYPLHIKLPLEVAATVLIAVSALYIFRTTEQAKNVALVTPGEIANQQAQTEDTIGQKDVAAGRAKENPALNKTRDKALPPQSVPLTEMKGGPSGQPGREEGTSVTPRQEPTAVTPAPAASGLPAPAVQMGKSDASGSGPERLNELKDADEHKAKGRMMYGVSPERKEISPAPSAAMKKMGKAAPEEDRLSQKDIFMDLKVADVDTAHDEIRKLLSKFGGRIVESETLRDRTVLTLEMDFRNIRAFSERLRAIGEMREKGPHLGRGEGNVKVKIDILKTSDR